MSHGFQRKQFFIKWASQFIIAQLVRLVIMVILIEKDFFGFFNLSFWKVGFSDLSDQTWNNLTMNNGRKIPLFERWQRTT